MSNYTPATATVIGALPYTVTQAEVELEAAPTGTSYASTCDATQYHAVWYRYTTGLNETLIAVSADYATGAGNYDPRISVWTGTLPGITQFTIVGPSETQNFCGNLVGDFWFYLPVSPFTSYWFQVTDHNNTSPLGDDLVFKVRAAPALTAAAGSILVNDDVDGFPAAVMSATDGSFLRFISPYQAGEFGDTLPSGELCIQDGEADTGIRILDSTFATLATADYATATVQCIKSNRTDLFYVGTKPNGGGVVTLRAVDVNGVTQDTWTLPANSSTAGVYAVQRDDTVFYYGPRAASAVIHAYDLVNDIALADLSANFTTERLAGIGDGYVADDGTILFAYASDALGATPKIRRFNTNGTVNHTYTIGSTLNFYNHFCFENDSPGSFIVWGYVTSGASLAIFQRVTLADVATNIVTDVPVSYTSGAGGVAGADFSISNSCPMLVTPSASSPPGPPSAPGTETVFPIRRVRRSPHLWDGASGHRLTYPGFQLMVESGAPRDDHSAPLTFFLRWSDDGGHSWSNLHEISGSNLGQYKYRFFWRRLGQSRDRIFEVVNSDVAKIVLLDALLTPDPVEGSS